MSALGLGTIAFRNMEQGDWETVKSKMPVKKADGKKGDAPAKASSIPGVSGPALDNMFDNLQVRFPGRWGS